MSSGFSRPKSSRGTHIERTQDPRYVDVQNMNTEEYTRDSRGRSSIKTTYYKPLKSDDNQANPSEIERPKSSRGRQRGETDLSNNFTDSHEQTPSPTRRLRPKSAKGRSRISRSKRNQSDQISSQADVLVLGQSDLSSHSPDDNFYQTDHYNYSNVVELSQVPHDSYNPSPQLTFQSHPQYDTDFYGDRKMVTSPHSEVDIDLHDHEDSLIDDTKKLNLTSTANETISAARVSPAMRPKSGRASALPPTATERRQFNEGAHKDIDFLRGTSNTPVSARPESANSFSRFNILPSIGLKPVPAQRNKQVPVSSNFREPLQREKTIIREPVSQPFQPLLSNTNTHPLQPSVTSDVLLNTANIQQAPHNVQLNSSTKASPKIESGAKLSSLNTHSQSDQNIINTTTEDNDNTAQPEFPPLTRQIRLPAEPKSDEADAILLAIKLPDGKRVQRHFLLSHTLETVLNFAEFSSQLDFTRTEIVCDAPRQVLSDLSVKLSDSGLQNRTVIHIQIPDT